ncbi:hypothetical protein OH76DRAFT_1184213 [Lentinus brumalis]|uniref:Uncharacterized protein n=1 Tax=Lentinus brumalis TaxID=2498619 RepID=A0A371CTW9_9APHY|nr:hypothetical protein OH76DRAFT_1184213 [Polyporus brumalis]
MLETSSAAGPSSSKITPSPSDVLPSLARCCVIRVGVDDIRPTSGCLSYEQAAVVRIHSQRGGNTGPFDFAVLVQEPRGHYAADEMILSKSLQFAATNAILDLASTHRFHEICTFSRRLCPTMTPMMLLLHPQQQYRVELRRQDRTASDFRLSSERRPMLDEQTPFALLGIRGHGARPRMNAPYTSSVARTCEFRRHLGAVRSPAAQRRDFLPRR